MIQLNKLIDFIVCNRFKLDKKKKIITIIYQL